MERNNLKVDVIYYVEKQDMYFVTPDCFGGYWYETLEEAQEQHGDITPITVSDVED